MSFVDIKGQKFGRLTALERVGADSWGKSKWRCHCDCGKDTVVLLSDIRGGKTRSCGCLARDLSKKRRPSNITHGGSRTRLYTIWRDMRSRCYNQKDICYPRYGGRGIKICDEWLNDFGAFQAWAFASGYEDGLTIDRIENDGDYRPDNCRWATHKAQANNRCSNKTITINGETHTLAEWSALSGVDKNTILSRVQRGWTPDRLLEPPKNKEEKHQC